MKKNDILEKQVKKTTNEPKNTKTEKSRLNIFYILFVLEKYTDEENPLSATEISRLVNLEFGYLSDSKNGEILSVDTVKRTLKELTEKIFNGNKNDIYIDDDDEQKKEIEKKEEEKYIMDEQDIIDELENINKLKHRYGYRVCMVMKEKGEYKTYRIKKREKQESEKKRKLEPKKYYYYDHNMTVAEIQVMKDALETYNYFSEEDIAEIVTKLMRLRQKAFNSRYVDNAKEQRNEDSILLSNIDILSRIIRQKKCANITYGYYNEKKELVSRKGYPKEMEPVQLMWSNGYYYLVVYYEKRDVIMNMRVDRIIDIEETEKKASYKREDFNPIKYRQEHPVMYGGKAKNIVLLCRDTGNNYIMNTIMDIFGKNANVEEATDEMIQQHLGHTREYYQKKGVRWLTVKTKASLDGGVLWVTQYCNDCVVVSPDELKEKVIKRLSQGLEYYK